jgi:tRNA(Ile)-lysidine synthase
MAEPDPFTRRFLENLRSLGVGDGARVLVALSGGADSVALLHLLRFASPENGRAVFAAHFDHAMRAESGRDAAWVAGLCRAWGVPLIGGRAEGALRTEEEAREARYGFLRQARGEVGADWIATAHHADDQAETVLFRLLRGTGSAGLAGIPPVDTERGLVRPLLPFTRPQIRRYARQNCLRWREDASNAALDPARNRIRHQILPLIERTVAPGARAALARLADVARGDEAAWDALLAGEMGALAREEEGALVLVRERLAGYDSPVAARLLRGLLRRFGVVPDRDGTRSALRFIGTAPSGRELRLAGGIRIRTEFGEARIERDPGPVPPDAPLALAPGRGEGVCRIGGRERRVAWWPADADADADADAPVRGAESFAVASDAWPLLLRGWLPGDRVRTQAGTRTLKRLFNDRRVPRSARARVPVLADARGRVLWVAGVQRGAPSPIRGEPGVTLEIIDA